jgi:hypothetical protein
LLCYRLGLFKQANLKLVLKIAIFFMADRLAVLIAHNHSPTLLRQIKLSPEANAAATCSVYSRHWSQCAYFVCKNKAFAP